MKKIRRQDYSNFYKIFSELGAFSYMLSVLDGIVEGHLYADDSKEPSYGILLTEDCYYLAGNLGQAEVKKALRDLSQSQAFKDVTGLIFSDDKKAIIGEIFGDHAYEYIERNAYILKAKDHAYRAETDKNFVTLTPDNIHDYKAYANYEEVYEESKAYWDAYPEDSKINFSLVCLQDRAIVASCYIIGESSSENSCELGIDTFEGYKRQGFGQATCGEAINRLRHLGYEQFHWHCFKDNIASHKTALKLGFVKVDQNLLAWFRKHLKL